MRVKPFVLVLVAMAASITDVSAQIPAAVPVRDVQNPANSPAQFTYTCNVTSFVCTPDFSLSSNQRLVIQNISGSGTPVGGGKFATNQENITITSTLNGVQMNNIVGPNYAIANTSIWYFNTPVVIYTDAVPTVTNNGPVYIQGYIVYK